MDLRPVFWVASSRSLPTVSWGLHSQSSLLDKGSHLNKSLGFRINSLLDCSWKRKAKSSKSTLSCYIDDHVLTLQADMPAQAESSWAQQSLFCALYHCLCHLYTSVCLHKILRHMKGCFSFPVKNLKVLLLNIRYRRLF